MTRVVARARIPVLAMCFAGLAFEGYDLVSYGTVLPQLISSDGWHLGAATAGLISTLTVVGMLIGSIISGALADFTGRRTLTIASCAWFSGWMAVCAAAPNVQLLGGARLMAGLGIGAFVPLVAALAVEFAPDGKGNRYSAIAWAGYPVGGVVAALVGVLALEPLGWRFLFAVGALPLITLVPLMYFALPESSTPSRRASDAVSSQEVPHGSHGVARGPKALFVDGVWIRTVVFGLLSASGLVLTYGLNTWLPQLMRANGYELGSALTFLMALNLGAATIPPLLAKRADVSGPRVVIIAVFLAAAASILALSIVLPLLLVYLLVFVAGAGTLGAQLLMSGFVATDYPITSRVAALSWISCAGRVGALVGPTLIGFLVAAGSSVETSFYVLAGFGILGAILAALIPRQRQSPSVTDVNAISAASEA
ncbi:MFS transporter [Nocardia vermiculata]|uniref:Aromatic acid/H+ symport family MFS transporter n=1 Tax=Nocardia vermiculata TaxID=257274 RepID=A0A846XWP1_9NOCA|nr:MFS transporter [Nocardia vermiculata]NKY51543.1 aromatic acid/H+ symport family MFS transporter [Nocardia vermiculata]